MQRDGTEDATDGDTSVNRVDVELVSDPGLLEALCINLRASVTDLREVINLDSAVRAKQDLSRLLILKR